MTIKIKATKLPLTAALRDYCQKKMDKTEKYLGRLRVMHCDLELARTVGDQRSGPIFRAEVNLAIPRHFLRVEKTSSDLYKAIDKMQEHLELVIKRHKEKLKERKKELAKNK